MNAPFPHPQASPAVVGSDAVEAAIRASYIVMQDGELIAVCDTYAKVYEALDRCCEEVTVWIWYSYGLKWIEATHAIADAWWDDVGQDGDKTPPDPLEPYLKDRIADRNNTRDDEPYVDPNREHGTWVRGVGL